MFTDPLSVTVGSSTISLPRTSSGINSSEYSSADSLTKLVVSHQYGRRTRRVIRLNLSKSVTDPLIPANSIPVSMSCYLTVDVPVLGYAVADEKDAVVGLATLLTASSGALTAKFLGGEN